MEEFEYVSLFQEEEHHWWYLGLHDLVVSIVRAEAEQWGRSLQILDAGCGTGRLCELMQPYGSVTGCDIHSLALEAANRRGIGSLRRCDLTTDELGTNEYHLITAMDVISHQGISDECMVFGKLFRALRKGGCLLIQVPAFEMLRGAHDLAVHTRRRYRRSDLAHLIEALKFSVEICSYRLAPFFLPALLWRTLVRTRSNQRRDQRVESDLLWSDAFGLNWAVAAAVKAENRLIRMGVRLPVGTSLFVVARK